MKRVKQNVKQVTDNVLQVTSNLKSLIRIIPGAPPGQIQHAEGTDTMPLNLKAYVYGEGQCEEIHPTKADSIPLETAPGKMAFITIGGMQNTKAIQDIGRRVGLHDLEIEDILNTRHRPKVDFYDDHLFILFRILTDGDKTLKYEHCAIILHQDYVLLIREHDDDQFEPIVNRIKNPQSRFHNHGTDYLAYALLDLAVDRMTMTFTDIQNACFMLEETYLENSSDQTLYTIKTLHRKVIALLRTSGPMREVVHQIINHANSPLQGDSTRFMNDVLDHVLQTNEQCLHLRDLVTGMISLHLSNVGQTTNEIMKFLTIMGSLFIPLTFIAGIYGMNFEFMPELRWRYGYFAIWGMMIVTAIGLLSYFRKRGWF